MVQRDHGREERGIKALGKRERERERRIFPDWIGSSSLSKRS
jgi:hypothetical protein